MRMQWRKILQRANDIVEANFASSINICEIYEIYNGMTGVSDKWKESGNCKFIDYLNVYNNTKVDINNVHFTTVKKLK